MFLTEKTEENGHLERFYGNVCLRKVVQNDRIGCPGCLETPSGHSSVVIDRDPPFLMVKMALFRQVMETKVVSNHYWDSMTPSGQSSIVIDRDPLFDAIWSQVMKAVVIIKGISVNLVKYYQSIKNG